MVYFFELNIFICIFDYFCKQLKSIFYYFRRVGFRVFRYAVDEDFDQRACKFIEVLNTMVA